MLTWNDWVKELENYIANHIKDTMAEHSESVDVFINRDVPLPLTKPTITLVSSSEEHVSSGGMNAVSSTQQSEWHIMDYFVTVNTDAGTGRATKLARLKAILVNDSFGKNKHELLTDIEGESAELRGYGTLQGDPQAGVLYEAQYNLTVTLLVPYTSETLL